MFIKRRAAPAALLAFALAGCKASETAETAKPVEDPALASALQSPIMTDPDLAQQSSNGSALTGGGPPVMELPPIESGPEAVAAAKAEAAKLTGKASAAVPLASGEVAEAAAEAITPAQLAKLINGPGTACAEKLGYGAVWSLRLPAILPIYPRGHLQEAAGSDKDGCKLRMVSYLTPVAAEDVLSFYATRAKTSGLTVKLSQSDGVQVLEGDKAGLALLIRVRSYSAGVTGVDMVLNGPE